MRFTLIVLVVAASVGSAQTLTVPNNVGCARALIITPPDAFKMPVAKNPRNADNEGQRDPDDASMRPGAAETRRRQRDPHSANAAQPRRPTTAAEPVHASYEID